MYPCPSGGELHPGETGGRGQSLGKREGGARAWEKGRAGPEPGETGGGAGAGPEPEKRAGRGQSLEPPTAPSPPGPAEIT